MSERFVAGLDAGTTKTCVLVLRVGRGSPEVAGVGLAASEGMKKGVVVDIEAASEAVKKAVSEAEASSGVRLRTVYASLSGHHIGSLRGSGAAGIKDGSVTEGDIRRAVDAASRVYVPLEKEVLHVLPAGFSLDGLEGIDRPAGMSGSRLSAKVRVVTASHLAVENLRRCCEKAGLKIIEVLFGPVACGRAALTPAELKAGAALIDMGGGTTDIAVYREGMLRHTAVLTVGGRNITNDIAVGLGVSLEEAERLKRLYGAEVPAEVEVSKPGGKPLKTPGAALTRIIRPRCEEMMDMIKPETAGNLSVAVLVGGTAMLRGMKQMAATSLGLQVRLAGGVGFYRDGHSGSPACSTALGLALHGAGAERSVYDDLLSGVVERLKGFTENRLRIRGWS